MKTRPAATLLAGIALTTLLGVVDSMSGWELGFHVFYSIPIFYITWTMGRLSGALIAVYASVCWFGADTLLEKHYTSASLFAWNSIMRLVSDLILVFLVDKVKTLYAAQRKTNADLEEANHQIKVLKGILPICASCKNIRNGQGDWEQMETYISKYSQAEFSHGICDSCIAKLYPELSEQLSGRPAEEPSHAAHGHPGRPGPS